VRCNYCNDKGTALTYINGRVVRGFCHCKYGKKREEERDALCRETKTSIEFDKKFRVYIRDDPYLKLPDPSAEKSQPDKDSRRTENND